MPHSAYQHANIYPNLQYQRRKDILGMKRTKVNEYINEEGTTEEEKAQEMLFHSNSGMKQKRSKNPEACFLVINNFLDLPLEYCLLVCQRKKSDNSQLLHPPLPLI